MPSSKIINEWKKKLFKPIYWLEGEEPYFIDQVVDHAEHNLLSEQDAGFNLTIFYGKDANWADVINACRRYPMFAERQVVILKEAQQMKDIEKLEAYVESPLESTVFVVAYKEKKVDGRSKLAKLLKTKGEVMTTKKLYENQMADWAGGMIAEKGYKISEKALKLVIDHVGNDMVRLGNEIDKLTLNLSGRKNITEDDIEKYVGVSKEFNVFELTDALGKKDLPKAIRIIRYFGDNPKAAPIQLVLPALYNFFSKTYIIFGMASPDEKAVAAALGVNPFFVKDYLIAAQKYGYPGVEKALLLLHHYNLKSVGIGDSGSSDASLLMEMAVKMVN